MVYHKGDKDRGVQDHTKPSYNILLDREYTVGGNKGLELGVQDILEDTDMGIQILERIL